MHIDSVILLGPKQAAHSLGYVCLAVQMSSKLGWRITYSGPTVPINSNNRIPQNQDRKFCLGCEVVGGWRGPLKPVCFLRIIRAGAEISWDSFSSWTFCVDLQCSQLAGAGGEWLGGKKAYAIQVSLDLWGWIAKDRPAEAYIVWTVPDLSASFSEL